MNEEIIPSFTKEDFYNTTTPFEWLYRYKDDNFKTTQLMSIIKEKAGEVGVKNFVTMYKEYCKSLNMRTDFIEIDNYTKFTGQELELISGRWNCEDDEISYTDNIGLTYIACSHPVIPIQRLINIDTGIEKLKLAYRKGNRWRYVIADKKTLASQNNIVSLADVGIAVNSENARYLIKYLADIENLNYDKIPELNSVARCGWISGYGFSPYVDNLIFDGDINFKSIFDSIIENGELDEWVKLAKEVRKDSPIAKIMLATSFASVLIEICETLPFFVHLWGGTEAGKTVALMLSASVWADPAMGKYIRTFNSTNVALELSASFFNSLPLMIDELMIRQDKKSFDDIIYQLTEGIGKGRGQKTGGLQKLNTWKNTIITTGEKPISSTNSNGGAVNRIIEIDCKDTKIFKDPHKVVNIAKNNFGIAGKVFINYIKENGNKEEIRAYQKDIYKQIIDKGITEKQALAGSLILTADYFTNKVIYKTDDILTIKDISEYLLTNEEISQNKKALDFIYDFTTINGSKFDNQRILNPNETKNTDTWGQIEDDYIYIIKSKFDSILNENGFSSEAFLSWANGKDLLKHEENKRTINKRINGKPVRCVAIKCNNTYGNKDLDDIFN